MYNTYNPQVNIDRINTQIQELQKMKEQLQQPIQPITQNFQLAPQREMIKYANSIDEVQKDLVIGDTPYFSKDMSVVWIKTIKGDIKTYELKEIVLKDEKDLMIESLQLQLNQMKEMIDNANTIIANDDESIKNEKSSKISNGKSSNSK